MKEKATIYDLWRICKYYGAKCCRCPLKGLSCTLSPENTIESIDETNKAILKWCKEHPAKTRQDKFLEMFPNASKDNGIIEICPNSIDQTIGCRRATKECENCAKSYWLAEVEE